MIVALMEIFMHWLLGMMLTLIVLAIAIEGMTSHG